MNAFSKLEALINAFNEISDRAEYSMEVINGYAYIHGRITTNITWLFTLLWSYSPYFCFFIQKDDDEIYIKVISLDK